jgi:hypothetical protein
MLWIYRILCFLIAGTLCYLTWKSIKRIAKTSKQIFKLKKD